MSFAHLNTRRRERVLAVAESLAHQPSLSGDYQEFGASGRRYEVKLFDDLIFTWWTDHAAREVHILRIEHVE